jgi:hypothetical protein
VALLACVAVLGTVVPSLGADGDDARCQTLADAAARCPRHTDVGAALPAVATRSIALPDGRTLVLGADANFDRLAVTAYDATGAPIYHRRAYLG